MKLAVFWAREENRHNKKKTNNKKDSEGAHGRGQWAGGLALLVTRPAAGVPNGSVQSTAPAVVVTGCVTVVHAAAQLPPQPGTRS